LFKGLQVYIEGRLQSRRWEDIDGCKHTSVEIVASEMMILGDRKEANQQIPPSTLEINDNYSL